MHTARTARTAPGPRHDPGTKRTRMDRDQDPGAGAGPDHDSDADDNDTKRTCTDRDHDQDTDAGAGPDQDQDTDSDSTHSTSPSTPDVQTRKAAGKPLFCCQICGIFMGPHNPRQLCAKYFCCNEP